MYAVQPLLPGRLPVSKADPAVSARQSRYNAVSASDVFVSRGAASRFSANQPDSYLGERLFINSDGYDKNWQWAGAMEQVIAKGVKMFESFASFKDLVDYVAENYHLYAIAQAHAFGYCTSARSENGRFGKPRSYKAGIHIAGDNRYHTYLNAFRRLFDDARHQGATWEPWEHPKLHGYGRVPRVEGLPNTVSSGKAGRKVLLIVLTDKDDYIHIEQQRLTSQNQQLIWAHLDNLFQEVKALPAGPQSAPALAPVVGQIHWWLSLMRPYDRGSAGISDMVTKILFDKKAIRVPRWRLGCSPDLEALSTPEVEAYAKNYANLFETNLVQFNQDAPACKKP